PGDEGGGEFTPTEREQVAGRIIGDPSAPVRIVEYADFQCSHCAAFAEATEPRLMDQYVQEGIAAFEFRHFPVLGPGSVRAAEAAECAGAQDRFWDYHDILFLRQHPSNDFADERLRDYARELVEHFPEFDVDTFDACLASDETATAVQQMHAEGQSLGVQATPTFFINGESIRGDQPLEVFQQAIEQARGGG